MLAVAPLLAVLDSIAAGVDLLEDALGTVAHEAGTVSGAAAGNRNTLAALDDHSVQSDLTPIFARRAALVTADTLYGSLQGAMLQRALDQHYGGSGGMNRVLSTEGVRVHWNLNKIGFQIDSRNVFPPALDPVARYEGDGAGTGIFVAGSDIDTRSYGPAAMQVVVDAMGGSARTLRLTLKTFDGSTMDRDVVVPADSAPGATIPVGAAGERFVGVTNIVTVNAGGTAADRVRVRSVLERVIAL